jgi:hypothetical protein
VANGLLVAVMVFGLVIFATPDWKGWNRIPDDIWQGIGIAVLASGPIGLVLCPMAFYNVKRRIDNPLLRRTFVGLNLVGIAIGLASLAPLFFMLMLSRLDGC